MKEVRLSKVEGLVFFVIIDAHVHTGLFASPEKTVDMREEIVLKSMELYNIDYALVSNAAVEYDCELQPVPLEMQISQEESFLGSVAFARKNKDKIGILPWIKPATETADERFEEILKENLDVIHGIKVHPFHSKTAFDSERVEPYIKLAQKYHLPVLTHTADCDEASPVRVYNMAKKYPDVNFVMAHMGLGTDNQEAISLLGKLPNLYGDTAWVPLSSTLQIVKEYGSKKLIFGSDSPIDGLHTYRENMAGEPSLYQQYFYELEDKIGTEAYEDIMYKNAMRVYGIHF